MHFEKLNPVLRALKTKRLKLKYDDFFSILFQICFQLQLLPLHQGGGCGRRRRRRAGRAGHAGRGLHSLPAKLNWRTFGNTSHPFELNLSTFRPRPRVNLGYMGDKVSLS